MAVSRACCQGLPGGDWQHWALAAEPWLAVRLHWGPVAVN